MTTREQQDLIATLAEHRGFLRHTVAGLTEEQARQAPTASALSLGGLIKHVTLAEAQWASFIEVGAEAMGGDYAVWMAAFAMGDDETLEGLLAAYDERAAATDALVASLPSLDAEQALPVAPWFEAGASWSARRVLMHVIAETAQHAGHADILRETIDGQKTMG